MSNYEIIYAQDHPCKWTACINRDLVLVSAVFSNGEIYRHYVRLVHKDVSFQNIMNPRWTEALESGWVPDPATNPYTPVHPITGEFLGITAPQPMEKPMTNTTMHFGTKMILATPMNRQAYNDYRGWTLPADEDGNDQGYLVEYIDGGQSNHPDHDGYISWSPEDVFDRDYQPTTAMSFGHAIKALKKGYKVARAGWNGKGMYLSLAEGPFADPECIEPLEGEATRSWIGIRAADKEFLPSWVASQTDMLADDWMIVE